MTARHARRTMKGSAALLAVTGLVLLFLPDEVARLMGQPPSPLIQVGGAGAFALAMINWMLRGAAIGGIYGRPIVVGNLAFALGTGGTLVRLAAAPDSTITGAIAAGLFVLYAAAFGRLLFSNPVGEQVSG